MVRGIVSGKKEEKTAEILYREEILFQILMRGLDQKHKKMVQQMLEDDTDKLLSAMTLVEEALMTYRKEMTKNFHSYRCMSCELFSNLHKQAERTARAKFNLDSSPFYFELTNGLNQMHEMFSGMNELIVKSENNLVLEMNEWEPRIVNLYKEIMETEKQKGFQIPEVQLREVKEDVKLVDVKKLSIDNLMAAAANVLHNQRRIYNCKMKECLKKAGGMMDLLQLKKHHDSFLIDARNTVLLDLKKIEGLESHLNYVVNLHSNIQSDWVEFKNENDKKLRQKEEMEQEVAGNKKAEENMLKKNVLEMQRHLNPKMYVPQFNGIVKPSLNFTPKTQFAIKSSATDTKPRILKPIPYASTAQPVSPEILQGIAIEFGFDFIRVGWMNPKTGRFEVLKNEWVEEATRSVVALTLEGEVLVGSEAIARPRTALKWMYSMKSLILLNELQDKLSYGFAGSKEVRKELLMGQMLSNVKKGVEKKLNGVWEKVVVTVPLWYTSVLRQATRDAATIAGFKHIHLVNETTAAAMSYAGCQLRSSNQRQMILVGVCNTSYFDVAVYYVTLPGRQVRMESCCGSRHGSMPRTFLTPKNTAHYVVSDNLLLRKKDKFQVEQRINLIVGELKDHITQCICVKTDPGNNSWFNFIGGALEKNCNETVRQEGDALSIVEGAAVIASLLSSKQTSFTAQTQLLLQNIIQDRMVHDFEVESGDHLTERKLINTNRVPFEQEISLGGCHFLNTFVILKESMTYLGSLRYRASRFRDVRLKLTVSNEGILKVELFAGTRRMHESVDFNWNSQNMTMNEVQKLADYIQSLEGRSVGNENFEHSKQFRDLLDEVYLN